MSRDIVFQVQKLTKTYKMGEVEVHALQGANLEIFLLLPDFMVKFPFEKDGKHF
jgi:hypothetical protein